MARLFLLLGAANGFLAVALGAFGAHALRDRLASYNYTIFQTGVDYQGIHALALLALGIIALHHSSPWLKRSGWLFLAGIMLFSGSLYLLAVTDIRGLGMVTPLGGVSFLAAWLCLGMGAWSITSSRAQ